MMRSLLALITLLTGSLCFAKLDVSNTAPMYIPIDTVTPKVTMYDVQQVIPLDFKPTDNTNSVMDRIADRGFQYWYDNSNFKNSYVGRVAEEAQHKMKTDIVIPVQNKFETSHKFSFKIEAFQALAKIEYTGWLNAMVDYNAKNDSTNFSVKEKLWNDKDFVVSHSITSSNQAHSQMGVRWGF